MAAPRAGAAGGVRPTAAQRTGARSRVPAAAARKAPPGSAGRRQRERSDATVEDLLTAARVLFAADGYAATTLDAVCERAGVTKGALYHHFSGKQQLFGAVHMREQERLARAVSIAYGQVEDAWGAVFEGSRAYLEASLDSEAQRITLLDAPGALGGEAMRDLGSNCRELTLRGVSRAVDRGSIPPRPAGPLTSILHGGLGESAMAIVPAEEPPAALREAVTDLRRLFDALAAGR